MEIPAGSLSGKGDPLQPLADQFHHEDGEEKLRGWETEAKLDGLHVMGKRPAGALAILEERNSGH